MLSTVVLTCLRTFHCIYLLFYWSTDIVTYLYQQPPKISLNPAIRPESYVRFSVNPIEKDSSIPHGQAQPASSEPKSIQNGSTKSNEGKTAKDNLNFHTQNRVETPQPKPVAPNKVIYFISFYFRKLFVELSKYTCLPYIHIF